MSAGNNPPAILPYSPENYPPTIPNFATEEEARDFFDTHDMTYFDDQFEKLAYEDWPEPMKRLAQRERSSQRPAESDTTVEPSAKVAVAVPQSLLSRVEAVATRAGVPADTLIVRWITAGLNADESTDAPEPDARQSA